jgi:hypothetical protein
MQGGYGVRVVMKRKRRRKRRKRAILMTRN